MSIFLVGSSLSVSSILVLIAVHVPPRSSCSTRCSGVLSYTHVSHLKQLATPSSILHRWTPLFSRWISNCTRRFSNRRDKLQTAAQRNADRSQRMGSNPRTRGLRVPVDPLCRIRPVAGFFCNAFVIKWEFAGCHDQPNPSLAGSKSNQKRLKRAVFLPTFEDQCRYWAGGQKSGTRWWWEALNISAFRWQIFLPAYSLASFINVLIFMVFF